MASALAEAEGDVLNLMKDFVLDFNTKLGSIREVLSETISEAWDSENEVLSISMEPFDTAHVASMVRSDNVQMNKIITVFSVLVSEMHTLRSAAETKYFGPLSMFGHIIEPTNGAAAPTRDRVSMERQLGDFLPFLQDLCNFLKRVNAVVRNTVAQLACLYHERMKLWITTFKNVEFDYVYEALGDLLTVLVTIDANIHSNVELNNAWAAYKRMMKYARADPDRYGISGSKLVVLEQLLINVDAQLMTTTAFGALLTQDFSLPDPSNPDAPPLTGPAAQAALAVVSGNRVFSQAFGSAIARITQRLKNGLADEMETYERSKFVGIMSVYALYRAIFRSTVKLDPKLFRLLWEVQTKVPVVVLHGRAVWFPADFLTAYAPVPESVSLKPAANAVVQTRKAVLAQLDDEFAAKTNDYYLQMCVWMVRMESELLSSQDHNAGAVLNARAKLLLHGVLLANQVRNTVLTAIHLHLSLGVPFQLKNVRALAMCVEILKSIQHTYRRRMSMIAENMNQMLGQAQYTLKRILTPLKAKLEKRDPSQSKLNDTKADVYAAICLAVDALELPPSAARRTVLQLALCAAQIKLLLKTSFEDEVRYQTWKIERLSTYQRQLALNCDCSFMYWVSNLVPAIIKDIYNSPPEHANRLQYVFSALRDSAHFLTVSAVSPLQAYTLVTAYEKEANDTFRTEFITPLARQVETDLRLHIHSVVLQQESLRAQAESKDWSKVLDIKPVRVFGTVVDVKEQVTRFLDATFYDHNTVALHDSRVYADMRNLAKQKFGLNLADPHLPGAAHYSESLDVLEIMRNIHIFVARYAYNMNTQVFIERAVDQKHLNVIDVAHIASSIMTHGMGIMNTTVNITYQFLYRKFVLFSEFMLDDHVKSPLMRDIRQFRSKKEELKNMFPFTQAERFLADMRKHGVTEAGMTYLDHFRQQITEIGNAMGYVRMVRSGGLHYGSNALQFIPDLNDLVELRPLAESSRLSPATVAAVANFDAVVTDLTDNASVGSEYFVMLVEVFSQVFRSEEQMHVRNFFVIVPALTINFVETLLAKKEKLHKRSGRNEASFTDDGFALGVAYILKLLDQDADFDSLHWFESAMGALNSRRAGLEAEIAAATRSRNKGFDVEHAQLSIKRLEALIVEFELLSFSFRGARVFFRDSTRRDATEVGVDGAVNTAATASSASAGAAGAGADAAAGAGAGAGSADVAAAPLTAPSAAAPATSLTEIPVPPSFDFDF